MRSISGSSQHRQHLVARIDRFADEPVQARGAHRHGAQTLERIDDLGGAREQVVDQALVVLHRRALRGDEGDDRGARSGEPLDLERAFDECSARPRLLAHGEALGDDLPSEPRPRPAQPREETLPLRQRHVVEHHRAEGVEEDVAVGRWLEVQLVGRQPSLGEGQRELAEREVLDEGDRVELVHAGPREAGLHYQPRWAGEPGTYAGPRRMRPPPESERSVKAKVLVNTPSGPTSPEGGLGKRSAFLNASAATWSR
jgi:hypothetical protein